MAYSGAALALIATGIEGEYNIFAYLTADAITTVLETGYFADGGERGMKVNDWVFCSAAGAPIILFVSAVDDLACTVEPIVLSLDGLSFPTTNPGPGSGLIWNNAGFLCVA